jgi:hypothetical protein
MTNFDGTVDNRWRPDLESSQRRVQEEESDEAVQSRELSLVPPRLRASGVLWLSCSHGRARHVGRA